MTLRIYYQYRFTDKGHGVQLVRGLPKDTQLARGCVGVALGRVLPWMGAFLPKSAP